MTAKNVNLNGWFDFSHRKSRIRNTIITVRAFGCF